MININNDGTATVVIDNKTFEVENYATLQKNFKPTIYLLQHNHSTGSQIVWSTLATDVMEENVKFDQDGFYTLTKILLPTMSDQEVKVSGIYYYYIRQEDGKLHKYFSDESGRFPTIIDIEISVEDAASEILSINEELLHDIQIVSDNYFSTCFLTQCYINIVKEIFNKSLNINNNNNNFKNNSCRKCYDSVDKDLEYKRDLISSALNVIQFLVDSNQFCEAQLLLERISGCNGLCKTENTSKAKTGCGCNR